MKNLILMVNFGDIPVWATRAKAQQLADWFKKYQKELGIDNFILMPDNHETKLFWLDGEINNPKDANEIKALADKFKPILSVIIDKVEEDDPGYKKALEELKELRELKKKHINN